jgi:hypothetical protein
MSKGHLKDFFCAVAPYGAGLAAAVMEASLVPSPTLVVVWAAAGYIGAEVFLPQRQVKHDPQTASP